MPLNTYSETYAYNSYGDNHHDYAPNGLPWETVGEWTMDDAGGDTVFIKGPGGATYATRVVSWGTSDLTFRATFHVVPADNKQGIVARWVDADNWVGLWLEPGIVKAVAMEAGVLTTLWSAAYTSRPQDLILTVKGNQYDVATTIGVTGSFSYSGFSGSQMFGLVSYNNVSTGVSEIEATLVEGIVAQPGDVASSGSSTLVSSGTLTRPDADVSDMLVAHIATRHGHLMQGNIDDMVADGWTHLESASSFYLHSTTFYRWAQPGDPPSWTFDLAAPGKYRADVVVVKNADLQDPIVFARPASSAVMQFDYYSSGESPPSKHDTIGIGFAAMFGTMNQTPERELFDHHDEASTYTFSTLGCWKIAEPYVVEHRILSETAAYSDADSVCTNTVTIRSRESLGAIRSRSASPTVRRLRPGNYVQQVLLDEPAAFWPLDTRSVIGPNRFYRDNEIVGGERLFRGAGTFSPSNAPTEDPHTAVAGVLADYSNDNVGQPTSDPDPTTVVGSRPPGTYDGTADFTIEAWLYVNKNVPTATWEQVTRMGIKRTPTIYDDYTIGLFIRSSSWGGGGTSHYSTYEIAARYPDEVAGKRSSVGATNAFDDDSLNHLVLTYEAGDEVMLYVNGAVVDSASVATITSPSSPSDHLTEYFNGWLSMVAYYDHALTPAEITAHYRAGTSEIVTSGVRSRAFIPNVREPHRDALSTIRSASRNVAIIDAHRFPLTLALHSRGHAGHPVDDHRNALNVIGAKAHLAPLAHSPVLVALNSKAHLLATSDGSRAVLVMGPYTPEDGEFAFPVEDGDRVVWASAAAEGTGPNAIPATPLYFTNRSPDATGAAQGRVQWVGYYGQPTWQTESGVAVAAVYRGWDPNPTAFQTTMDPGPLAMAAQEYASRDGVALAIYSIYFETETEITDFSELTSAEIIAAGSTSYEGTYRNVMIIEVPVLAPPTPELTIAAVATFSLWSFVVLSRGDRIGTLLPGVQGGGVGALPVKGVPASPVDPVEPEPEPLTDEDGEPLVDEDGEPLIF